MKWALLQFERHEYVEIQPNDLLNVRLKKHPSRIDLAEAIRTCRHKPTPGT